ncbi:MAG TPA: methyltransferase domain-containing protein, partial [Candidatus Dormibacteraeota bacterium]|nr:methyltransferase domain-containing protein [Candidatus Dormibacteraeota bacterium]
MPDREIVEHYETIREEDRITGGLGHLELLRTHEVLRRHLPSPPARVIDVGGGPGVHAQWLADSGYRVHVVDLTPRHVSQVLSTLGSKGVTAEVGDARELS